MHISLDGHTPHHHLTHNPNPNPNPQLTGRRVAIKKVGDTFCDLVDAKRILREIKLLRVGWIFYPHVLFFFWGGGGGVGWLGGWLSGWLGWFSFYFFVFFGGSVGWLVAQAVAWSVKSLTN
jgi:hypothetical protein